MEYLNEQQQVDQLKAWWKEYGISIVVGIICAIIIVIGLRYYQRYEAGRAQEASYLYTSMMNGILSEQPSTAQDAADALIKKYHRTPYAAFAELWLAKQAIQQENYTEANAQLETVIQSSRIAALRQIARIQQARIALQQKAPTRALTILTKLEDPAYKGLVDEVRGDAYLQMNQPDQARSQYQLALKEIPQATLSQPTLSMKLADLPVVATTHQSGN